MKASNSDLVPLVAGQWCLGGGLITLKCAGRLSGHS